jgi:hypothetical protein
VYLLQPTTICSKTLVQRDCIPLKIARIAYFKPTHLHMKRPFQTSWSDPLTIKFFVTITFYFLSVTYTDMPKALLPHRIPFIFKNIQRTRGTTGRRGEGRGEA